MAVNITLGNETFIHSTATWQPLAVISLLITVCALTFNGALLIVFCKDKKLRTPFNVYLINLLLANFIYCIFDGAPDLVQNLYPVWDSGRPLCTIYMYAFFGISLAQFTTHPLIAVNRTCALWVPVYYRRVHNGKSAVIMCALGWVAAHLIALPGLIMDDLYYRLPEVTNGCVMNTEVLLQGVWLLVIQFVSLITELMVLLSFPLIWYKERTRRKIGVRMKVKAQANVTVQETNSQGDTDHPGTAVTVAAAANINGTAGGGLTTGPSITMMSTTRKRSYSFLLLAVLTISVGIFWSPSVLYFLIQPFNGMSFPTFEKVSMVMYNVQSVIDPIVLALTLTPLRRAIVATYWCRK